jgi:hypothetical protein
MIQQQNQRGWSAFLHRKIETRTLLIIVSVPIIAMVLLIAYAEIQPFVSSILWGRRHHHVAEQRGMKVVLPFLCSQYDTPQGLDVRRPPHIGKPIGSRIAVDNLTPSKERPADTITRFRRTFEQIHSSTPSKADEFTALGRSGVSFTCFETITNAPIQPVDLWCLTPDASWIVTLSGEELNLPDFYKILNQIPPSGGKP